MLYCVYNSSAVEVYVLLMPSSTFSSARSAHFSNLCAHFCSYDPLGNRQSNSFSLLSAPSADMLIHSSLSIDSFTAVTYSPSDGLYSVHLVDGLEDPKVQIVHETGIDPGVCPSSITLFDGSVTTSGLPRILLGLPTRNISVITVVDEEDNGVSFYADIYLENDLSLPAVPINIIPSPCGENLAIFGEDGSLVVINSTLTNRHLHFSTKVEAPPSSIAWCGSELVALAWADAGTVLLIHIDGASLELNYFGETVHVSPEIDGLRVISSNAHYFVQITPKAQEKLSSFASNGPESYLRGAYEEYQAKRSACDPIIRSLIGRGELEVAIYEILEAASTEWRISQQKELLHVARYGRSFAALAHRDLFVSTSKTLRVLNYLRSPTIDCPLTWKQLQVVSADVVIDRLLLRGLHDAAMQVAKFLSLDHAYDRALIHWSCSRVRANDGESDAATAEQIIARLSSVTSVRFADIAAVADRAGRRQLATILLNQEPRSSDKVSILLHMNELIQALKVAEKSGDTSLILLVLDSIRRATKDGQTLESLRYHAHFPDASREREMLPLLPPKDPDTVFLRIVLNFRLSLATLRAQAERTDPSLLANIYLVEGKFTDYARTRFREISSVGSPMDKLAQMKECIDRIKDLSRLPNIPPHAKNGLQSILSFAEEKCVLLGVQLKLQQTPTAQQLGADFYVVETSLYDTLVSLYKAGTPELLKHAETIIKGNKLDERTLWHIRLKGYVEARNWKAVVALASEKRSPIGYTPFLEALVREGAVSYAKEIAMTRINQASEKVKALAQLQAYEEAIEAGVKGKAFDALVALENEDLSDDVREQLDQALNMLQNKR